MRKLKYLLVATIMSTTLLFGCGSDEKDNSTPLKELSAQELVDNVSKSEAMKFDSFEFGIDASVDVKAGKGDSTTESNVSANLTGQVDMANKLMKMETSIDLAGQKTLLDCYVSAEGETPVIYYCMNGVWFKMPMDGVDVSGIFNTTTTGNTTVDLNDLMKDLSDAKVETKDNTYVLTGKIDVEKIISEDDSEEAKEYSEMVKGLMIDLTVRVNSDYTFKSLEISLDNFKTELMGSPIEIKNVSLKISLDKYNNIDKITIPADALNATEMDMSGLM